MRAWMILWAAATAPAQTPLAVTLCDLAKDPHRFHGALVSVRAEAEVGFEVQSLVDHSCSDKQIWFDFSEDIRRDEAYRQAVRAWKNNDRNIRERVTATVSGRFETGGCFGHSCYSRSRILVEQFMNVNSIARRLAPNFSAYDCAILQRLTRVPFRKGHIDNMLDEPAALKRFDLILTDPSGEPLPWSFNTVVQVAVGPQKLRVLKASKGSFQFSGLAPGAYVFSAVADGFQSVTGCVVVAPSASRSSAAIKLPWGV
jgi:hypothetical protein